MAWRTVLTVCMTLWLAGTAGAQECGVDPDTHCQVETGTYRIAIPEGSTRPGAMIWLHGWGGSADGAMKNKGFRAQLAARGMAFIAPDGRVTSSRRPNKNWAVNDGRDYERDDVRFLRQVTEDAVARHGIDPNRILLAGFSRGGSMVWDVACRDPDLATAYAPVAGAFWEPMWPTCKGPVRMFHTHGWTDRVVPLEGRSLGGGLLTQGDVFQSLFALRATNGCGNRQPETALVDGETDIWRRSWTDCANGEIELMLHPGGHAIPRGWLQKALDWFEQLDDCRLAAAPSPSCS